MEWDESDERTKLPNAQPACAKLGVTDVFQPIDTSEVDMQALMQLTYTATSRQVVKPDLDSYDSGEEFSLSHWLQDRDLVEDADEELAFCTKAEAVPKKPVSEVESATAYQHFARNVV